MISKLITLVVLFLCTSLCEGTYFAVSRGFAGASSNTTHILLQIYNESGRVNSWSPSNGEVTEMRTGLRGNSELGLGEYMNRVSVTNLWDTDHFFMIAQDVHDEGGGLIMRLHGTDTHTFSLIPIMGGFIAWVKVASSEKQSAISVFTLQPKPGGSPSPYGGIFVNFHTPLSEYPDNPKLWDIPPTYKQLPSRTANYAFQPNICAIGAARYIIVWGVVGMTGIYASIIDVWGNLMHSNEPYKIDFEGKGVLTPSCVFLHDRERVVISYMVSETGFEPGMYLRARMYTNFSTPEVFNGFHPIGDYYPMADNQFQPHETTTAAFTKRTIYGMDNIEPSMIACGKGWAISWITYFGVFVQSYGILEDRIRFDSLDVELSWARIIDASDPDPNPIFRRSLIPSVLVDLSQHPAPMGPERQNQVNKMWVVSYWDYYSYWDLPGVWYAGGWVAVEWPENSDYVVPGLFETIEVPSPVGNVGIREDVGVAVGENSIVVYWKQVYQNEAGEMDFDHYWQLFDEHMVPRKMETQKVVFQFRGVDFPFTLPLGVKCELNEQGRCPGRTDMEWHKPETLLVSQCHNGFILVGRSTPNRVLGRSVLWYQGYEWSGRAIAHSINFDLGEYHWFPWNIRVIMPPTLYPETHIFYLQNTTRYEWREIDFLNCRIFQVILDGNLNRPPETNLPFFGDFDLSGFDVAPHPTQDHLVFGVITNDFGWCFRYHLNPEAIKQRTERRYIDIVGLHKSANMRVAFQHPDLIVFTVARDPRMYSPNWWAPRATAQYIGTDARTGKPREPMFADIYKVVDQSDLPMVPLYPDQSAVFVEFNGTCCSDDFFVLDNPNGYQAYWKAVVVHLLHDYYPDRMIVGKYKGMWLSKHTIPNNDTFTSSYRMYPSMGKNRQLGLVCAWTEPAEGGGNSVFVQAVGADSATISGLNISHLPKPTPVPTRPPTTMDPGFVFGPDGIYLFTPPPGDDWWPMFASIVPGYPTRPPAPPWVPSYVLRGVYFGYIWNGSAIVPGYANLSLPPAYQTYAPGWGFTQTPVPLYTQAPTYSPTQSPTQLPAWNQTQSPDTPAPT